MKTLTFGLATLCGSGPDQDAKISNRKIGGNLLYGGWLNSYSKHSPQETPLVSPRCFRDEELESTGDYDEPEGMHFGGD